jgi:hypothetical protein
MSNTMMQAILWLFAGAVLMMLISRRRKRKSLQ